MDERLEDLRSKKNPKARIKVLKGHFATSNSHLNTYIDMSTVKTRHNNAREAAKELANEYMCNTYINTIVCLDETEVIGTFMAEQLADASMAKKLILQAYYYKKEYDKMIAMEDEAVAAQTTDEGRSDVYYWVGVAYNEKIEHSANAEHVKNQAVSAFRKVTAGRNVANAQAAVQALTAPAK